jgi:hypothetical protein
MSHVLAVDVVRAVDQVKLGCQNGERAGSVQEQNDGELQIEESRSIPVHGTDRAGAVILFVADKESEGSESDSSVGTLNTEEPK